MKLETQRLILRKPKLSDWTDVVEGAGEFDVAKMTEKIPYPYKKKNALDWLKNSIKKFGKEEYAFLIELKKERKVIGVIHLMSVNKFSGTATTGSWINKKYWEKGYITEAKIAVNEFAFDKLKLRKLNSTVMTTNAASNRTQQSVGYRKEGLQMKQNGLKY